jgi:hypothetical protein
MPTAVRMYAREEDAESRGRWALCTVVWASLKTEGSAGRVSRGGGVTRAPRRGY